MTLKKVLGRVMRDLLRDPEAFNMLDSSLRRDDAGVTAGWMQAATPYRQTPWLRAKNNRRKTQARVHLWLGTSYIPNLHAIAPEAVGQPV
jgi:hypothetical protein